ncbi:Cuticle protein 10.9 [Nymphon striatum]|nr:Cuticle protein 10.9 [Nymphon striatum]
MEKIKKKDPEADRPKYLVYPIGWLTLLFGTCCRIVADVKASDYVKTNEPRTDSAESSQFEMNAILLVKEAPQDLKTLYEVNLLGYGYAPKEVKIVKVEKVEKVVEAAPQPYEFSYDITDDEQNSNGRQESGDEHGNMKGSYSIQLANGLRRWVEYVADEGGFRATIKTNEPGTDNQSPADVDLTAEPIEVEEAPKEVKIVKVVKAHPKPHYGYGYQRPHYGYGHH